MPLFAYFQHSLHPSLRQRLEIWMHLRSITGSRCRVTLSICIYDFAYHSHIQNKVSLSAKMCSYQFSRNMTPIRCKCIAEREKTARKCLSNVDIYHFNGILNENFIWNCYAIFTFSVSVWFWCNSLLHYEQDDRKTERLWFEREKATKTHKIPLKSAWLIPAAKDGFKWLKWKTNAVHFLCDSIYSMCPCVCIAFSCAGVVWSATVHNFSIYVFCVASGYHDRKGIEIYR